MKLYLLSQTENTGYDKFDSCVVAARNEDEARTVHPYGDESDWTCPYPSWASCSANVSVRLIGLSVAGIERGVICASFNAG